MADPHHLLTTHTTDRCGVEAGTPHVCVYPADVGHGATCDRCGSPASWAIVSHYLDGQNWRDVIQTEQVFGALCAEHRSELIGWMSERPFHV